MEGFVKSIEEKNKKGKGCLGVFLALIIAMTTLNGFVASARQEFKSTIIF